MHPNPVFRREPEARALEVARDRGFGILSVAGPDMVLAAQVPFVMDGGKIACHLVRSNPVARHLKNGPAKALMAIWGPDAYISPDWYGEADKVPTWNYVAVHLRGELSLLPEERLKPHLEALSAEFENRLPKAPWKLDKLSEETLNSLLRQIVPAEMTIESVDSTFKLNQNRGASARNKAAAVLAAGGTPGMETEALSALMQAVPDA